MEKDEEKTLIIVAVTTSFQGECRSIATTENYYVSIGNLVNRILNTVTLTISDSQLVTHAAMN